jgi:hypothetical protein
LIDILSSAPVERQRQIDLLVAFLGSVSKPRHETYVSAPLTSGRWSVEWQQGHSRMRDRSSSEYAAAFEREVVGRNRVEASVVVKEQRERQGGVVIDPTLFPNQPGWSQDDYRRLWGEVIERYAARVVFVEGWAYSGGCAFEFLVASSHRIETVDSHDQTISLGVGIEGITRAIDELGEVAEVEFLRRVLASLEQLAYART